jgi:hypothetical protein
MISKKSNKIKATTTLKPRSLKIQPYYRVPEFNMIRPKPTRIVPSILLCGVWLQKAGFKTGQRVKVQYSKKQLIITPE